MGGFLLLLLLEWLSIYLKKNTLYRALDFHRLSS